MRADVSDTLVPWPDCLLPGWRPHSQQWLWVLMAHSYPFLQRITHHWLQPPHLRNYNPLNHCIQSVPIRGWGTTNDWPPCLNNFVVWLMLQIPYLWIRPDNTLPETISLLGSFPFLSPLLSLPYSFLLKHTHTQLITCIQNPLYTLLLGNLEDNLRGWPKTTSSN